MYTESEKNANQLVAQIKKTFENADKALQYKKDRQKQYSDLVNSMKKSKEESRAFDIMKNNVSEENYIKIKQDQRRSKTEPGKIEMLQLVGRMKKNFKKDLGSSPASGTVQALMMPPALIKKDRVALNKLRDAELMRVNTELYGKTQADTMSKMKPKTATERFYNTVKSYVLPSMTMPDPKYEKFLNKKQYEYPDENKNRYSKNRWLDHVKQCMTEHPEYTYKQALQKCKETYTKKTKKINL